MNARKIPFADMLAWMVDGARMVGRNPGPFALATAVTVAVIIVICVLMVGGLLALGGAALFSNPGTPPDMALILKIYALVLPLVLLLLPPLAGGWFRLCRTLDGGPAHIGEFFVPFQRGGVWLRLVGCAALAFLAGCIVGGGVFVLLMGGSAADMAGLMTATGAPNAGAVGRLFLVELVAIYLSYVVHFPFALAFADIAIEDRGLGDALARAFAAWASNLLAIAAFTLVAIVSAVVVLFVAGLTFVLLVMVVGLVSKMLSVLVVILMYLLLIWAFYSWMFTTMYLAWRSVLGQTPTADAPGAQLQA